MELVESSLNLLTDSLIKESRDAYQVFTLPCELDSDGKNSYSAYSSVHTIVNANINDWNGSWKIIPIADLLENIDSAKHKKFKFITNIVNNLLISYGIYWP